MDPTQSLDEPAAPPEKRVGALSAGLAVLRYLNHTGRRAGVSRIARDLQLNPSTCFNLLRTLVYEKMLDFDPVTKTYALDLGVIELAKGAFDQATHSRLVRPHLNAIAIRHRVASSLWEYDGNNRMMMVEICDGFGAMRVHMQVGQRLPLHIGAYGRCVAGQAQMSKAKLRAHFKGLRWENPPTFEAYWASCEAARENGYGVDTDCYVRSVTLVSAIVFDVDGNLLLSISTAALSSHLTPERIEALGIDLRDRTRDISRFLIESEMFDRRAVL